MRIRWSEPARADVLALREYIARDSPFYARRFTERLVESVEILGDVRELIFHAYRIIYLVEAERVTILTVVHGSRDLSRRGSLPWEIT